MLCDARQNTLPATVSLRAQIDGVTTHSWDLDAILSVDGIVTVILEHVGLGTLRAPPGLCACGRDVIKK